jgi:uncharacterized Fe-S cluster protein YjdI/CDGSH-type Zn-finger protein
MLVDSRSAGEDHRRSGNQSTGVHMTVKDYAGDGIVVHWDASRCIHAAICTTSLPEVFDVTRRPWITADAADADTVEATVDRCPTGALRATRARQQTATPAETTTILPVPDGPLLLRGSLRLLDEAGNVVSTETRLALCRCGASRNKPYCDNSHRAPGTAGATTGSAEGADCPADICLPQHLPPAAHR